MDKEKNINNKRKSVKKPTGKVANIESARLKAQKKTKKHKRNVNFYYSFLTIILLICLMQIGFSAILNISKTIAYHNKIVQIRQLRDEAENENIRLKREIKGFSSTASLEAIARNNLKMAGKDEVLIIINDNYKQKENKSKKKKGILGIFKNGK